MLAINEPYALTKSKNSYVRSILPRVCKPQNSFLWYKYIYGSSCDFSGRRAHPPTHVFVEPSEVPAWGLLRHVLLPAMLLSTLHTPLARSSHRSLLPPARCSSRSSRIPPAHGALAFEKPIPLALATSHSPAPTVRPYREGATSSCALPRLRPTTPRSLRRGDCPTRRRRRVRARGGRRRGRPGRAGPPAPSPRSRRRCPGGRRGGRRALRGGRRRHWCPGGPGASSCSTCSSSYSVRTHSV